MSNKIILLITLVSFSVIVSQPFMYILALKQTQLNLTPNSYLEVRKLIDAAMRSNFKYVLYIALLSNLALIIVNAKNPGGVLFITAIIALICLLIDVSFT
jgi:phosphate starvation-inducible membrane PsiE